MKRMVILVVALLLVSGSAYACPSIGLFNCPDHSSWCATGVGFYPVEMWVWSLANPHTEQVSKICDEFSVCYPINVIQSTVTWNTPLISVSLGDLPSGLSVCYIVCQTNWFWICHQLLYVTDGTQTMVYICPHPGVGVIQYASCEPGYPTYVNPQLSHLYINYEPGIDPECAFIGTETSSWGAIKSMVGE